MKKISTLIASTLCILAVAACAQPETSSSFVIHETSSNINEVQPSSTTDTKKYNLKLGGIGVTLMVSPDLPKDGEYEEGHKFDFTIKIIKDHNFTPYFNGDPLEKIKSDSVEGGFDYYSFVMPNHDSYLHITDDPFYFDKAYSFEDIFGWVTEINETSLKGIRIEYGYIGVDPSTNFPTTKYSEEQEDLVYNLTFIKAEKVEKVPTTEMPPGGYYREVTYCLKSGLEYGFTIANDFILNSTESSFSIFKLVNADAKLPDIITSK